MPTDQERKGNLTFGGFLLKRSGESRSTKAEKSLFSVGASSALLKRKSAIEDRAEREKGPEGSKHHREEKQKEQLTLQIKGGRTLLRKKTPGTAYRAQQLTEKKSRKHPAFLETLGRRSAP